MWGYPGLTPASLRKLKVHEARALMDFIQKMSNTPASRRFPRFNR